MRRRTLLQRAAGKWKRTSLSQMWGIQLYNPKGRLTVQCRELTEYQASRRVQKAWAAKVSRC